MLWPTAACGLFALGNIWEDVLALLYHISQRGVEIPRPATNDTWSYDRLEAFPQASSEYDAENFIAYNVHAVLHDDAFFVYISLKHTDGFLADIFNTSHR